VATKEFDSRRLHFDSSPSCLRQDGDSLRASHLQGEVSWASAEFASRVEGHPASHNEGRAIFTASRRTVRLAYAETLSNRALALKRERQINRWTRAKKEALIAGDL